jgi:hypothetical protein
LTITIFLIVVGVAFVGARFATKRRTISPIFSLREQHEASVEAAFEHEQIDDERLAKAAAPRPEQAVELARASAYLLSDWRYAGSVDRTAIMLDTMAGPGLCTPRTA